MLRKLMVRTGMLTAFAMITVAAACAGNPAGLDGPEGERCYSTSGGIIVCER